MALSTFSYGITGGSDGEGEDGFSRTIFLNSGSNAIPVGELQVAFNFSNSPKEILAMLDRFERDYLPYLNGDISNDTGS